MFEPLRGIARQFLQTTWPAAEDLSRLAASRDVRSGGGKPLRFEVAAGQPALSAADYETQIHDEGVALMRAASWHDLFNACAWLAFPRTKAALNQAHVAALRESPCHAGGRRSSRRDALTLLDESGVLVVSSDAGVLSRLRGFEWKRLLWNERETVLRSTCFLLFGHGLYEKALSPYVGMTGHALLLAAPDGWDCGAGGDPGALRARVDALAGDEVATQLTRPRDLTPLPLLGVPGWWPANEDAAFYDDTAYFRPGRMR